MHEGVDASGISSGLGFIRMITSAHQPLEVDERITLDDSQVLSVLEKMCKQRQRSLVQFHKPAMQDFRQVSSGNPRCRATCPPN